MTAVLAEPLSAPVRTVTVRQAPRREPPFDDERPARHLSLVGPLDRPLPFEAPSRRRLTERRDPFSVRPTGRGELPDPKSFGRRLLVAALEVLAGRRSLHQLAPYLSQRVYSGLASDLERPGRVSSWRHDRPVLRSVRVCEPADGVAELAAVVRVGSRCRAVAVRLEGLDGRWRCVRLQVG